MPPLSNHGPNKAFLFSLLLGALSFIVFTSGAFVIDHSFYEMLAAHRSFHMGLIHACIGLAAALAWLGFLTLPNFYSTVLPARFISDFSKIPPWISVGVLAFFYFALQFTTLSFMHLGLGTSLWDLGFNDTIIWSTAHGKFLLLSVRGGQNALGEHFTPIFMLLAPIYWFSNSVFLLFLVQTLVIAACIPLTYLIARKIAVPHVSSLCLAAAVFFYQPLRNGILHSFEAQTFADPFLLLGFYLVLKEKHFFAFLSFAVALMAKENIVMETAGIGLFFISQKRPAGWGILALALSVLALNSFWIEPKYTFETNWYKWGYYSHIVSPSVETWRMWLRTVFDWKFAKYLLFIFAPLVFLSFRAPAWVFLFGPALGIRLLSNFEGFRIITAHYTSGLNALIFISAAYGMLSLNKGLYGTLLQTLRQKLQFLSPETVLCSALVFCSVLFSGIPQLFKLERDLWEASNPNNQRIVKMLNEVPTQFSVVSTETLLAQMTHRHYLFSFTSVLPGSPLEETAREADLLVVDRGRIYEGETKSLQDYVQRGYQKIYEYSFMSLWANSTTANRDDVEQLLTRWKQIETETDIPYRKMTRHYFKILASIFGIFYIAAAFKISRTRKT